MSKFEMHVAGPDDIVDFDDELEALKKANDINKAYLHLRTGREDVYPFLMATVSETIATTEETE